LKPGRFLLFLAALALAACSGISYQGPGSGEQGEVPVDQPPPAGTPYPDLGKAPELTNTVWLNTDAPLRMKDLAGKVVLIDMWTLGCINCQHTIPSLVDWYVKYASQGLVIIGNHYPEFDYEKDLGNLKQAVEQWKIKYPVAQDNDGATWTAYHNAYWPTFYLVDKRGHIRYVHIGEGSYQQTEEAIQALLAEPAA
jgi:thiol-disulfide isomerase/thioredoxin